MKKSNQLINLKALLIRNCNLSQLPKNLDSWKKLAVL